MKFHRIRARLQPAKTLRTILECPRYNTREFIENSEKIKIPYQKLWRIEFGRRKNQSIC